MLTEVRPTVSEEVIFLDSHSTQHLSSLLPSVLTLGALEFSMAGRSDPFPMLSAGRGYEYYKPKRRAED